MTPDPSSGLVERVAAAMADIDHADYSRKPLGLSDMLGEDRKHYLTRARAAIRVVVEACASEANAVTLYAGRFAHDGDHSFHEYGTGAMECLTRIRALLPTTESP